MSVIFVGDSHFGTRNTSQFYLDKQMEFYDRLIDYIEENEVSAVFHLGDFFDDRRELNVLMIHYVDIMLDKLDKTGVNNYFLLGNHDVYYKNDNEINGVKPLLKSYKNLHSVDKPTTINSEGHTFALIPWINNVNVESTQEFVKTLSDDTYILGHFGFSELTQFSKSQDLMEDKKFKRFKSVISGHYHLRLKHENILYLGSIIDFKWQEELTKHGFMVMDKTGSTKFINNEKNIHEKFIIESKDDLQYAIDNCKDKDVKIILSDKIKITDKEYDFYINQIDKLSYFMNVTISNDVFLNDDNEIVNKSFLEYLNDFITNKDFENPKISNEKMSVLLTTLYKKCKD